GDPVTELLFLVSRQRAELLSHLSHEFEGGDVHVLIDRRKGERRRSAGGRSDVATDRHSASGGADVAPERRSHERRARRTTARGPRSLGSSIRRLHPPAGRALDAIPPASPIAVREIARYLREAFRFATPIPSWDVRREGQGFVLLDEEGRPMHRLL